MSLHQAWLMWLQSSPLNKSLKVQSAAKAAARPLCHPTQEPAWFPWLPAFFCSFWCPNLLTWALPRSPHMPFWVVTGLSCPVFKRKGFWTNRSAFTSLPLWKPQPHGVAGKCEWTCKSGRALGQGTLGGLGQPFTARVDTPGMGKGQALVGLLSLKKD